MGILFTKLWRLFNHQGKDGAVTFIMNVSKWSQWSEEEARCERQLCCCVHMTLKSYLDTVTSASISYYTRVYVVL